MNNYTQINYEERIIIADLWRNKKSYYCIAKWLKRKYDTIKNEIERNGYIDKNGKFKYSAKKAHEKYLERKERIEKRIIENDYKLEKKIIKLITKDQFSPEQISGRYKKISHQTIYNWIYRLENIELKKEIVKNLRRRGKKYKKTSRLHGFQSITAPKTMIDERPKEIDDRKRLGDLEGDTVILNGKERFYTLVDRKSGYLFLKHLENGYAENIHKKTVELFNKNRDKIKSITYDNGVEFSYHDLITLDTNIPIYFCFPYHSWEKGTNENTNGLIRQYYPKGKIHDKITESNVRLIEKKLNSRPRKRLNYLTPYEVFVKNMDPDKTS